MSIEIIPNYKPYLGNQNLKRSGVRINWTPELIQEWIKCSQDVIYFVRNYMKIVNVDSGLINFDPYDYQVDMFNAMAEERYCIFTTSRQAGKSTVTCGYILWYILFNENKNVALLANKGETAREILSRIQLAYQHLPKWLQHGVVKWNKGSFELENGSRVLATATSTNNIRGFSINLLFIDEAAFIENWDEFFTSVYPTISSGKTTQIVLVSTPNGLNHFYAIWQNAIEKRNNYRYIMVKWDRVPGRDDNWKKDTLAALNFDMEKFSQEYECEFQGSSGTLIAGWKLKQLVYKVPLFCKDGLSKFVEPMKDHTYVCIVDVSRGKGLDYSAFSIIDITEMPYQQVFTFRNNLVTPIDYAEIIFRVCRSYNNAAILPEINDIGEQVASSLYYDFEYENILSTETAGRLGKRITSGFGSNVDRGIRTTKSVKAIGCSILKLLIEQNQLIINDFDTINELSTFSRKGISYEAESGKHDDMVMGLVLFAWLSDQMYFKELTSINTLAKLREKTDEEITQDLMPFGFIENGMSDQDTIDQPVYRNWIIDPENEFI